MFIKFPTQLISMQKTIQVVYTKKGLLKPYKMSHQIGDCVGSMSARNVSKLQYVDHCTFRLANRLLLTSSPPWKGRGFPSRGFIVPTIGSGLHPSFGGQSSGSENHSHLKVGLSLKMGLSLPSSSPLKEGRDDGCSSHSPIKPSIELGRSVISVTTIFLAKRYLKLSVRRLSIPAGEAFRPLNPQFLVKLLRVLPSVFNVISSIFIYHKR